MPEKELTLEILPPVEVEQQARAIRGHFQYIAVDMLHAFDPQLSIMPTIGEYADRYGYHHVGGCTYGDKTQPYGYALTINGEVVAIPVDSYVDERKDKRYDVRTDKQRPATDEEVITHSKRLVTSLYKNVQRELEQQTSVPKVQGAITFLESVTERGDAIFAARLSANDALGLERDFFDQYDFLHSNEEYGALGHQKAAFELYKLRDHVAKQFIDCANTGRVYDLLQLLQDFVSELAKNDIFYDPKVASYTNADSLTWYPGEAYWDEEFTYPQSGKGSRWWTISTEGDLRIAGYARVQPKLPGNSPRIIYEVPRDKDQILEVVPRLEQAFVTAVIKRTFPNLPDLTPL